MNARPTHLDLFSGIGGFALAAQWAGFQTVAFVEREAYCQKLLAKHWPQVPVYSDICQFGGRPYRGVDLLTGGFPCQPFSVAGERRGKEDDRYLWPEMLRVIRTVQPAWVLGENVAGLDGLGLDDCISDLEASGYEVAPPLEIPACAVDARHVRNRVWILANTNSVHRGTSGTSGVESFAAVEASATSQQSGSVADAMREQTERDNARRFLDEPTRSGEALANPAGIGRREGDTITGRAHGGTGEARERSGFADSGNVPDSNSAGRKEFDPPCLSERQGFNTGSSYEGGRIWPVEPQVGRVANGIPRRVDRLKGLGNAIVPAVAYQIIKGIYAIIRP